VAYGRTTVLYPLERKRKEGWKGDPGLAGRRDLNVDRPYIRKRKLISALETTHREASIHRPTTSGRGGEALDNLGRRKKSAPSSNEPSEEEGVRLAYEFKDLYGSWNVTREG